MKTHFDPTAAAFSLFGHKLAIEQIYPLIFPGIKLKVKHFGGEEKDLRDKVDVEVALLDPPDIFCAKKNGRSPKPFFSVQERWRDLSFYNYQDVTFTYLNRNTNQYAEYLLGTFGYMLYGYINVELKKIIQARLINFRSVRFHHLRGDLKPLVGNNGGRKNQDFLAFPFQDLEKHGCVDWQYNSPINLQQEEPYCF